MVTTNYMKRILTMAIVFLFTLGAWADPTVTIIKKLNGVTATTSSPGNVSSNVSEGVCTLTVTPVEGNYVTSECITVSSTVTGNMAQIRPQTPNMDVSTIIVEPKNASADPSGTTEYTFTMPTDGSNAEVIVDFQSRKSVTADMITLSSASFTYNGSEQSPTVTVKDGSTTLTANTHYTVSIKFKGEAVTPIDADTYDIVVTGIGIYTSSATKTFTITAKSITEGMVTLSASSFVYNDDIQYPTITLKDGSTDLTEDEDFEYTYEQDGEPVDGPGEVGSYDLIISGIGNYGGEVTKTVTISPKATTPTVTLATTSYTYDGTAKEPDISKVTVPGIQSQEPIELEEGDYDIAYTDNTNAGENTAKATVTLKGNYSGSGYATFTITPKSIAGVTIADIADQTYTGSAITPAVTVTDGTKTLVLDTDYTVGYSNNTNTALATANEAPTVTITGKGNYDSGTTATKKFNILPAASTITAQNTSTIYNGVAQAYDGATVDQGTIVITYYSSEANRTAGTSGSTDAPTDAGTYYIKVTQTDANYTAEAQNVTFTISPMSIATATVSVLSTQTLTYTGSAITPRNATVSIMLTDGAAAATALTAETDYTITGYANNTNAATADSENAPTITVTGMGNFTGTATGKFTIAQAEIADVEIGAIDDQPYTGSQIKPEVTVTFNGNAVAETDYTISYGENINPGDHAGSVTLTSTNKNFSTASTKTASFKINDILYDLWIGGERVTSGNKDNVLASAVPTVVFDGTSTLTLNEAYITSNGLNGIESGLATLTVDIVGNNVIECSGATDAAFKGTGSNKAIVFTRDPDEYGSITVKNTADPTTNPISGLTASYENNLGLLYSATNTEYTIEKLSAPEIERTAVTDDGVTVALVLPDGDQYANSSMYYTITYKDETVDETAYTEAFTMSKPGTVTAYLVSDLGGESESAEAKYYGYPDAPYTLAISDDVTPAIYPAIEDGDLIGFNGYSSENEAIATFTDGKITATGAGYVTVTATLTGSDMAFTVLNPMDPDPSIYDYPITFSVSVGESLDNIFAAGQTFGTYCNTSATSYKVPNGIKAYIVTGVNGNEVTLAETKVLPPYAAILLEKGENATAFTYTAATDADGTLPSGNLLKYAADGISTTGKEYVLFKDEFVKATGTVPVGKCYLDLSGIGAARASYGISHGDGDNTGIKDVMLDENGAEKWYDLQGRRIVKPTKKGLYIKNGKTVVINNK